VRRSTAPISTEVKISICPFYAHWGGIAKPNRAEAQDFNPPRQTSVYGCGPRLAQKLHKHSESGMVFCGRDLVALGKEIFP
jgi:hypothetical protein